MSVLQDALDALRASNYGTLADMLESELARKDRALDVGIRALDKLSQKGSITAHLRETALMKMWGARQESLIPEELPKLESLRL